MRRALQRQEIVTLPLHKLRPSLVVAGLIVLAGFALSAQVFFPGFMSADSFMQFGQSRTLRYSDWHPPLMSWLWSQLNHLAAGPEGMLYFQLALLWSALAVWCWQYRARALVWLIPFAGFLPWVLNFEGVLWKDIGMAFALLLLTGIAAGKVTGMRLAVALLLFFYAINLRHNAIVAAVPVLLLVLARWRPTMGTARLLLVAGAALALTLALGNVVNYQLIGAERTKPLNFIIVDDLSFLSLKEQRSLIPGVTLGQIQACSQRTISETRLVARDVCMQSFGMPSTMDLMRADLKPAWLAAIGRDPASYMQFRLAAFGFLLRSPDEAPFYFWHAGVVPNKFGVIQQAGAMTPMVEQLVDNTAAMLPFLFKPYWWVCAGMLLLLGSVLLRATITQRTVQVLLGSALLYTLAYLPVTPMADFRYVYWSVLATTIAALLLLVDWPGLAPSSPSRKALLAVAGGSAVLIFANFSRVAAIDMDRVFLGSLGPATVLPTPRTLQNLVAEQDHFTVTGPHPQLDYVLPGVGVVPADITYTAFDFACRDSKVEPTLQLLWWGDQQPDAQDGQMKFVHGSNGLIQVPMQDVPGWKNNAHLTHLRIKVHDFGSCTRIDLRNLKFYSQAGKRLVNTVK